MIYPYSPIFLTTAGKTILKHSQGNMESGNAGWIIGFQMQVDFFLQSNMRSRDILLQFDINDLLSSKSKCVYKVTYKNNFENLNISVL